MNKSELLQENEALVEMLTDMRDQIDAQLYLLGVTTNVDLDEEEAEDDDE
jgi:hypothetical protein